MKVVVLCMSFVVHVFAIFVHVLPTCESRETSVMKGLPCYYNTSKNTISSSSECQGDITAREALDNKKYTLCFTPAGDTYVRTLCLCAGLVNKNISKFCNADCSKVSHAICLNDGHYKKDNIHKRTQRMCDCKPGTTGQFCQVQNRLCENLSKNDGVTRSTSYKQCNDSTYRDGLCVDRSFGNPLLCKPFVKIHLDPSTPTCDDIRLMLTYKPLADYDGGSTSSTFNDKCVKMYVAFAVVITYLITSG